MEHLESEFDFVNHISEDDGENNFCNYDPYELVGHLHNEYPEDPLDYYEEDDSEDDDLTEEDWDLLGQWITDN